MSKTDGSLALLPSGFADVLPPDAHREAGSIHTLMELFGGFGYDRVKPPLLEFEESLLAPGPGSHLALKTFRVMDPVSQRMLGVRPDITAQIARIASSRLNKEARPLRLAYANDVLRTRAGQLRTTRQFTQVGCELIDNTEAMYGDIEICILPLIGLKALGFEGITIDLTIPGCVARLMEKMPDEVRVMARKGAPQRDVSVLKALGDPNATMIAQMMEATGRAQDAFSALLGIDGLSGEPELRGHIERLSRLHEGLEAALSDLGIDDVTITVDLIEQSGFEYHKTYGFTLFSAGVKGELGRGGAYDMRFGDSKKVDTARGFTLYMDTISGLKKLEKCADRVFVPANVPLSEVRALQSQGLVCVRGTDAAQEAFGSCTHVYEGGEVCKI
jgi:ATP phosphoribosyltransferase regulatory subunit